MKVLDIPTYELLVLAYRDKPANHTYAAKYAKCNWRTAKRAWTTGWKKYALRPIQDITYEDRVAARSLAFKEMEAEEHERALMELEAHNEAAAVLTEEGKILRLGRQSLFANMGITARLMPAVQLIAQKLEQQIKDGNFTNREGLYILRLVANIQRTHLLTARDLIESEHRERGEPQAFIDTKAKSLRMSPEEAKEELSVINNVLAIARERGEEENLEAIEAGVRASLGK